MAIDLIVHLTDTEQAKILEIAAKVVPGATPAKIKKWAEKQAKEGLRESVNRVYNDYNFKSFSEAWPEELPEVPPEQT